MNSKLNLKLSLIQLKRLTKKIIMLDNSKPFPRVVTKGQIVPLYSLSKKYCHSTARDINEVICRVLNKPNYVYKKKLYAKAIEVVVNEFGLPDGFYEGQFWFAIKH